MNLDRLLFAVADWLTPSSDTSPRWELKNRLLRLTGLNVGEHTAISRGFICYNASQIVIERYVAIGQNAHFFNFGTLRIGEFATLAQNVSVVNGWHATEDLEPRANPSSPQWASPGYPGAPSGNAAAQTKAPHFTPPPRTSPRKRFVCPINCAT